MKYDIYINQLGVAEAGLWDKTDLIDWAIIHYLKGWFFAEEKKTIFLQEKGKQYVWVNYNHLISEMPALKIKSKNALTERFKKLKKLGLIDTIRMPDGSLYFRLTAKCVNIIDFRKDNLPSNSDEHPVQADLDTPSKHDEHPRPSRLGQHKHNTNKPDTNKKTIKEQESAPQSNPQNPSPANSQSTKIPDLPPDIGTIDDWLSWSLENFRAVWKRHGKQLERSHPRYAGVIKYIGAHLKYLGTTPSPVVVERLVNIAAPDYWITGAVDEMIATLRNGGDPKNFNLERFYRTLRKYEQMNLPTDRNPYKYLEERRQERKEDAVKL